ncbi:branched-chain amino acid ABC transporter substrate-binding protein [Brenneria goodwinii]|uniref:branched-chain amino acid ABC transporter substrate-binding protein n=1 Tax=Brenneria goodwinii TaxID=1109412 RepID=UPI000EF18EE3|nr:branched-chain amino acid ABC transporter substrate-binding protein [Brenneria goodwinii]MCG8155993.1 branched-chain amino acid ABC transporter substrate-binding protein [Brenneria goodwinii]MCG8161835.1 branched-chain amino acid ABC transporter substrate-binding protein [Brenneria goodwinii]MCG8166452.1 branched-chain amino acid ABC transporter substrate-binding protein [Brenneria goodwinii]MCG8169567.1 branched-chain amino acid ABC transporter substrate-binding protein [Brenneria goodwinii
MKFNKGKTLLMGCMAIALSQAANAADIKVAVVGAMSGPVAQYGDMEFIGARQAIADINAKGGVDGNKLVGVEYDDACDPKQAVAVANKVINDGIRYVIGHLCSSSTQPASDIYEEEGVIMITPAATNADLTTRGYNMVLRTTGLDSDQGPTAAKYIVDTIKPQRIAVVHDKQQYGEGLARAVQDNLKKAGANVVLFEGVTAGDKDFSTLVARLKKENVDFVYFGGYYPEMGQILRQARQAGMSAKFMGPEGVGNSSLSNIAGEASEGMLVTLPKRYDQVPANQPIVDALKAKKLDPTGPFVWTTYAALQSLTTAMQRSGSMEPEDLASDLKAKAVDTVMGPLSWDAKGDLKGFEFGVFEWHADGTSSEVK